MPIEDLPDLRRHLQWAVELEHSTIPPYLCALYSIPEGANTGATAVIRSVVMEEMLHMTLAANVLNAVGGKPFIDKPDFIPAYPTYLPYSNDAFLVELLPFSTGAIETFLRIERPAPPGAKPEPEGYETIGQFYEAIAEAIERLTDELGPAKVFTGKAPQVGGSRYYYGGGGEPIAVTDLASAKRAIAEIAEQGEGLDHTIFDGDQRFGQVDELAHYFRFNEILAGRRYLPTDTPKGGPTGPELPVDWTARYPMRPNPKAAEYEDRPEVHRLMVEFNRRYTGLLATLHAAFNGAPEQLMEAVPQMYALRYAGQALMAIPSGKGDGTTVGPSFEYTPSSRATTTATKASGPRAPRGARTRRSGRAR